MGYVIPAGYSRVVLEYDAASAMGSQVVTGFGVNEGPGETLLNKVQQWWTESLKLRTNVGYRLQRIEARNDFEVLDRTIGQNGVLAGEPSPPNTAALFKMGSGLVGRMNRGRMYLPGVLLDNEVSASGTIDNVTITSLTGVMAYLLDLLDEIGAQPVILHSGVGAPTLVTNGTIEATVATQRRRLRR